MKKEYVILGLKHKKTGRLKVYNPDIYPKERKREHVDVEPGQGYPLPVFSPFPFETFSSLDYEEPVFKEHFPTYLLVEAELEEEKEEGMKSAGILYHRFRNHPVRILEEFHEPFSYALKMLKKYGSRLGTYHLTTWLIHEETRSPSERKAIEEILKRALQEKEGKRYKLDISLDKYTLAYVDFLSKQKGIITFGSTGSIDVSERDMRRASLSPEGYLFLWEKMAYPREFLFHYPTFGKEFYQEYMKGKESGEGLIDFLYGSHIPSLASSGADMDYFFSERMKAYRKGYPSSECEYESVGELVSHEKYVPAERTYDPYEGYCCPDCDGYEIDWSEEPYDYLEDEQVEALEEILDGWSDYLTEGTLPSFEGWSPDIFKRYLEEHPGDIFVEKLKEKYC